MKFKDYYKTLGVEPDASADDIRRAYRKLARKYHPDRNKESGSEDRFKEVGEAYEVLKDAEKRKQYDQLRAGGYRGGEDFRPPPDWGGGGFGGAGGGRTRAAGGGAADGFSDFSEFFESLFGGGLGGMGGGMGGGGRQARAKGRDITATVEIDLNTAFNGGKRRIALDRGGNRQNLEVNIPAGVTPGRKIRLSGQGEPGPGGGPPGDLLMEVKIAPHPLFELDGRNVFVDLPVAPWEAALGAEVRVPTLGGKVNLNIPAGSSSGKRMRLKGRGLPGKPPGDQIVTVKVVVPKPDSDRERALYEELAEASGVDIREGM